MSRIFHKRTPMWVRLKVWWQLLWIPKNEFHKCLFLDFKIMKYIDAADWRRYVNVVYDTRRIAHNRDLDNG